LTLNEARIGSLDVIRGVAVMGIILMNIVSFALPEAAYLNPTAYGGDGVADKVSWALSFLLIDNKIRGLFSMLFGASMLLVYERAQARNGQGALAHRRRMVWLMAFGLFHFFFIWSGDILFLYGACGLIGMTLLVLDVPSLRKVFIILLGVGFLLLTSSVIAMIFLKQSALHPGADAATLSDYRTLLHAIGPDGAMEMKKEISLYHGDYSAIARHRFVEGGGALFALILTFGPETIGLMGLGMLLLRNGFLTGDWTASAYAKTAIRCYIVGVVGLVPLLWLCIVSGFDPVTTVGIALAWSMPFRLAMMMGHAALILLVIKQHQNATVMAWIAATGRTAFSNYIGTSIIMTVIFYGYGLGLYGQLSRWQIYMLVPPLWILMLAWSKPWLTHFNYGPLEWLWRSLSRGQRQTFRRR
jgi:uncharacterized protein